MLTKQISFLLDCISIENDVKLAMIRRREKERNMNPKPYTVKMQCPISGIEEEVHFYEIEIDGTANLDFKGCDHEWHKCDDCANCHKLAYNKIINGIK